MQYLIYLNNPVNAYVSAQDTTQTTEDADKALSFYSRGEACDFIDYDAKYSKMVEEDAFSLTIIKQAECRGCKTMNGVDMRYDAYNIETGHWCDTCYESSKYPYKKERYDYAAFGERLDDDY
jgi:hypothetical protein